MTWLREAWHKVALFFVKTYYRVKWSPWNPWSIGAMNMAWSKYAATPMYEGRVEVDREFAKNTPNYEGDFPYESFIEYDEFDFFYEQRTLFDRARLIFAPFSFGNRFSIPLWRIRWWWYGINENEVL